MQNHGVNMEKKLIGASATKSWKKSIHRDGGVQGQIIQKVKTIMNKNLKIGLCIES